MTKFSLIFFIYPQQKNQVLYVMLCSLITLFLSFHLYLKQKSSNLQRYNFSPIPATNNSAGGTFYHKKTLIFGNFLPVSAHFSLNLAIISMNIVHISEIFLIFAPKYAHNRINQGYNF